MSDESIGKLCKTVVVEVRPRLQSVNVFIELSIDDNNNEVKIVLNTDNFQIIVCDKTATIPCKDIKVLAESLSCLKISDNSVSFRFATNNNFVENLGTFKTELLTNNADANQFHQPAPFLLQNTAYRIQCVNCGKPFNSSIKFQRILPLPSENSDSSDWFCHGHGNTLPVNLEPTPTDIFYTNCYVHVNNGIIDNTKTNDKLIVCKYCLSWLGLNRRGLFKLWFNTVEFLECNNTSYKSSALADVFITIQDVIKNSLFNSVKLVLSCQSSLTQTDYIFIWVLERKLQILFGNSETMKKYHVAKVLFKFVANSNNNVQQWQNDSTVNIIEISKPMILEVLKHLHNFNKVFPKEFSRSNDFNVSYLFMYEPFV